MKEYVVVNEPKKEIKTLVCDKCGLESHKSENGVHAGVQPYIESLSVYWGYGSTYDQELWEYDLCEKCIVDIFKDVKKSVYVNEIDMCDTDGEV